MPTPGLDEKENIKPFEPKSRPLMIPYGGRWEELGYKDPVNAIGRWRFFYYSVREKDPYFYDKPIRGILGPSGLPVTETQELEGRDMPSPVSHEDWRDRRYFLDPNVKAIYEKYPISKHHPGLPFRPRGPESFPVDKNNFTGSVWPSSGLLRDWPGILPRHWKFHAAPFGEDCHVKTAVAAKYGLWAGTSYFFYDISVFGPGRGWRWIMNRWFKFNKYTIPIAAAWAASSCIATQLRGKDDFKNMVFGGVAAGSVVGMHRGFFYGWYASVGFSLFSILYYYWAASEQGFFGPWMRHEHNLFYNDPASYKWADWTTNFYENPPVNW